MNKRTSMKSMEYTKNGWWGFWGRVCAVKEERGVSNWSYSRVVRVVLEVFGACVVCRSRLSLLAFAEFSCEFKSSLMLSLETSPFSKTLMLFDVDHSSLGMDDVFDDELRFNTLYSLIRQHLSALLNTLKLPHKYTYIFTHARGEMIRTKFKRANIGYE